MMAFNGLVLAGGQSRRMGKDKSQLKLCGKPLEQHMAGLLEATGAECVWISKNQPGAEYLEDVLPGKGPLSGIHSALLASDLPVLVVPVDMPMLAADSLTRLAENNCSRGLPCVFEGGQLPLLIKPDGVFIKIISDILQSDGPYSIKGFLRQTGFNTLNPPPSFELENINYPSQWQLFERTLATFIQPTNKFQAGQDHEVTHGAFS